MKKIDFKITVWERVYVPDQIYNDVLNDIKNDRIQSSDEIFGRYFHEDLSTEMLMDTTFQMMTHDNNGMSTIEILDDDGNIDWANGLY